MEQFIKGDIVVIPFPFSDLSGSKRRPALVLSDLPGDDVILCQITSKRGDPVAIAINEHSFSTGSLPVSSFVRPSRIFTANKNIVIRKAGTLKSDVHDLVVESIIKILR
jgi:mRNA interferase MazF